MHACIHVSHPHQTKPELRFRDQSRLHHRRPALFFRSSLLVSPLLFTTNSLQGFMSIRRTGQALGRVFGARRYSAAASATSCSAGPSNSTSLSPLRYHIFSEPLPYPIGLKLQHDIIDRRLRLKREGKQTDDVVLFLGTAPPIIYRRYAKQAVYPAVQLTGLQYRTHANVYDWPA